MIRTRPAPTVATSHVCWCSSSLLDMLGRLLKTFSLTTFTRRDPGRNGRAPADISTPRARRHKGALWPHSIKTSTECLLGSEPSKAWTLQRYGRCSLSSSSLPSVLLPSTGPSSATGSGTSTVRRQGIMSDHSAGRGRVVLALETDDVAPYLIAHRRRPVRRIRSRCRIRQSEHLNNRGAGRSAPQSLQRRRPMSRSSAVVMLRSRGRGQTLR
jgi:hypothetical protein